MGNPALSRGGWVKNPGPWIRLQGRGFRNILGLTILTALYHGVGQQYQAIPIAAQEAPVVFAEGGLVGNN